jgi:hypothetical protein
VVLLQLKTGMIENNIAFICYSHSEYSDVWDMFFGQLDKYLPNIKKYLFTDKVNKIIADDINVITYDDKLSYSDRVSYCLSSIDEEICLFHHEDMVLYNSPDLESLNKLYELLINYNIDYIKLLKGGHIEDIKLEDIPINSLYYIPHTGYKLSFAIQPTLWKVNKLLEVYKNSSTTTLTGNKAAGNFELSASDYINNSDILGLYWFNNETKRGAHHYNSSVYPHGNFISKGKWVYSEYNELEELHNKYNINKNIRGTV